MTVNIKNWQELKKPNALEVKSGNDPKRRATFVAEPLERGFGLTLGNALRRVLLSSLQGAAITSIKIENVLHEFSSIPGVREDVTDIVLNIKEIAIKMDGDDSKRMVVRKQGPGQVTAGDARTPIESVVVSIDAPGLHPCQATTNTNGNYTCNLSVDPTELAGMELGPPPSSISSQSLAGLSTAPKCLVSDIPSFLRTRQHGRRS